MIAQALLANDARGRVFVAVLIAVGIMLPLLNLLALRKVTDKSRKELLFADPCLAN